MIRYRKALATVLCVVMAAMPATAFAAQSVDSASSPAQQSTMGAATEIAPLVPTDGLTQQPTDPVTDGETPAEEPETTPSEAPSAEGSVETPAEAAEEEPAEEPEEHDPDTVQVMLNGSLLELSVHPKVINGSTYIPVRNFCEAMGCTVYWDAARKVVTVKKDAALTMTVKLNFRMITANDRSWYMDRSCAIANDSVMIPIRAIAKVFSCTVAWNQATKTVSLTGGKILPAASDYYNQEDLLWIARIINCEARHQPLDGKVGVANVVLNRMASTSFPNTASGVIFDTRCGVQFTPSQSKKIYNTPSDECVLAAKLALEGYETAPGCLYFINAGVAANSWAGRNRPFYAIIGDHAFYC